MKKMSAISLIEVSEPAVQAPAPVTAEAQPQPQPQSQPQPEAPSRGGGILPIVAASFALFASSVSIACLVVTTRTVSSAALVVADAQERQVQLAEVGELVKQVDALRVREKAALERMAQFSAQGAATPTDVNRAIDNLKQGLAKRDPEGGALALVRDGQSELAERIGQISLKLERVETMLKGKRPTSAHPE
jgi:hypothetical protein